MNLFTYLLANFFFWHCLLTLTPSSPLDSLLGNHLSGCQLLVLQLANPDSSVPVVAAWSVFCHIDVLHFYVVKSVFSYNALWFCVSLWVEKSFSICIRQDRLGYIVLTNQPLKSQWFATAKVNFISIWLQLSDGTKKNCWVHLFFRLFILFLAIRRRVTTSKLFICQSGNQKSTYFLIMFCGEHHFDFPLSNSCQFPLGIQVVPGSMVQGSRVELETAHLTGLSTVMVLCGHLTLVSLTRSFMLLTRKKIWML